MKPGIDPKVDYAFKRLFGREQNSDLLLNLVDAVLEPPPERLLTELEILNPFSDKETLDDKLSILDIKARDREGRQYLIEMQMLAFGAFRQRLLYYWARAYQQQLHEGDDYVELRPTYSICFVNTELFRQLEAHHLAFRLLEERHQVPFTNDLALHILELPKFNLAAEQLVTPKDIWLYFLRHAAELDSDVLPAALDRPEIHRAMKELLMLTQNDRERELYEARLKMQRDIRSSQREEREQGRQEGREEGRQEGREEGRKAVLANQIRFCQRLLQRPLTALEDLAALSSAELERQVAHLETAVANQFGVPPSNA